MSKQDTHWVANPDITRWNIKYDRGQSGVLDPKGEPEFIQLADQLDHQGMALDVAAGRGRNALYLAKLGYRVIACDGAETALKDCSKAAQERGLNLSCMVCDLDTYRFSNGLFDLLVVVRYLNRNLLPILPDWIRPNGWLFYKTFNTRFLKTNPRFNPDYTVKPGELDEIFSRLSIQASDIQTTELVCDERMSFVLARKLSENN
ncbi:MAG: methyltransferase domain-containing protein [Gammaproteobacteria bacterium]|nr:methyltransferase domain-containing protein [Gammaproteobacteria bacterium]MCY4217703.1 methyltransferase domain-containing protein [Gammaproteobacteria bacterium]MCY4275044.1 methyltransferase domain-containing protein [Gammaproteobacteria bacterium]